MALAGGTKRPPPRLARRWSWAAGKSPPRFIQTEFTVTRYRLNRW